MPELPEVETIKLGLERRIKGLVIKNIQANQPGMLKGDIKDAIGGRVENIWRRAKVLVVDLDNGYNLVIHLKMTGQLVFQSADEKVKVVGGHPQAEYNKPLPHAHTHIIITFIDGSHLYFNDLRRFGWMIIMPTDEVEKQPFIRDLGPEPLGSEFKSQTSNLKVTIQNSKRAIKTLLMDQTFIAGIGNIYSDEILYRAGIRPDRPAASLSEEEFDRLFRDIPEVLQEALTRGGTSDSTYIGVDGERGDYLRVAAVYHKAKCPKGHPVERKKIGGRTAHFCPVEQK